MTTLTLIHRLHAHRRWASARALEACRPLTDAQLRQPFPIGQGSVLATLAHLFGAERAWLTALEGNPEGPSPFGIEFASLAQLETDWSALEQRWRTFFERLTDADLERPIAKRSTSSGAGRVFVTPMYDVLLHVPLHAQYTLAQLANMLRHLGRATPFDPMLITMSRAEHAAK